MMNERIIKLGLDSGMLNYVDNETPRHYFLCGNADEKDLEKFAELVVRECIEQAHGVANLRGVNDDMIYGADTAAGRISKHFGVEK
jgi:hypothetical protein